MTELKECPECGFIMDEFPQGFECDRCGFEIIEKHLIY